MVTSGGWQGLRRTPFASLSPDPPNVSCVVFDHLSPSGPSRCPCPRVDTPPQSLPSSYMKLYSTDRSARQVAERNGNRCQCLCQDVERENVCQGMVFRSTVASHPPLSGYSAPEGHFPAQRLGGSLSSRILSLPLKRLRR